MTHTDSQQSTPLNNKKTHLLPHHTPLHHIKPHHIKPHHIKPHHIKPHHIILSPTPSLDTSQQVLENFIKKNLITRNFTILYKIAPRMTPQNTIVHHAKLVHTTPCHITLEKFSTCHITSHHTTPNHTTPN